jgi:hypothetical protein
MAESIERISFSCGIGIFAQTAACQFRKDVGVGSGQKSKGGFCSLDCYAAFYQHELAERARRISQAAKRIQD